MILIAILICLAVQRFANLGGIFKLQWFENYLSLSQVLINKTNKWIGLLLIVVPVFIVLWILHLALAYKFFGIFYLLLLTIVLFFCMDARDLRNNFKAYFESMKNNDLAAAINIVKGIIDSEVSFLVW